MKILLLILGVVVVALNLLLWHTKRKGRKTKAEEPDNHKDTLDVPLANSIEILNSPKVKPLKQSAASELGISIEQLDRMSVNEIEELAVKKGLI